MKRSLYLITALLTPYLRLQAAPEPGNVYVGGKIGLSRVYVNDKSCTAQLPSGGLIFGRQLNPVLALECSYEHLFHIKDKQVSGTTITSTAHGCPIALKLNLPIRGAPLDFFAKLGFIMIALHETTVDSRNPVELDAPGILPPDSTRDSETMGVFSLLLAEGLEYKLTSNLSARLEYQWAPRFDKIHKKVSNHVVSLGIICKTSQFAG